MAHTSAPASMRMAIALLVVALFGCSAYAQIDPPPTCDGLWSVSGSSSYNLVASVAIGPDACIFSANPITKISNSSQGADDHMVGALTSTQTIDAREYGADTNKGGFSAIVSGDNAPQVGFYQSTPFTPDYVWVGTPPPAPVPPAGPSLAGLYVDDNMALACQRSVTALSVYLCGLKVRANNQGTTLVVTQVPAAPYTTFDAYDEIYSKNTLVLSDDGQTVYVYQQGVQPAPTNAWFTLTKTTPVEGSCPPNLYINSPDNLLVGCIIGS